jgi:hypothetical protein
MRRPVPAPVSRSHSGTGARARPASAHGTEPAPAALTAHGATEQSESAVHRHASADAW